MPGYLQDLSLDDEAEMIVHLNTIRPDWRDHYDTVQEALDDLVPDWAEDRGDEDDDPDYAPLDFNE